MKKFIAIFMGLTLAASAQAAFDAQQETGRYLQDERPHHFNFKSDVYLHSQPVIVVQSGVDQPITDKSKSFSAQMASQKNLLKPQHFNFKSDVYIQLSSRQ